LNRKIFSTTTTTEGEKVRYFLYDGQNEIGAFDESLHPLELRILAETPHAEIGAAIGIELNGKAYAPIHDISGNLAALIPLDGSPPTTYRYSAFGEEKIEGDALSPWRFSSKRAERSGLIYYGRRFYTPEYGRWLSPDPAGFTDGMNLYAFVHNDPLTHFDEYGLYGMEDFGKDAWNIWTSPRVQGPIQMGLATWEMGASVPLLLGAPPVGAFVLAHGVDQFQAGLHSFLRGEHVPSVISQCLRKTGMHETPANILDSCFSGLGSKGAGLIGMGRSNSFQVNSNTFSSRTGWLTKFLGNPLERNLLSLPMRSRQVHLNEILKNTPRPASPKFLSLNKDNYRANLIRATGINPGKAAQAHHIFPQKFRKDFMRDFNINIDDPKYLTWIDSDVHRQIHKSGGYNARWDVFFDKGKTNFFEYGKQLADEFKFEIGF
jgi:RHS repeat-associated protein